LHGRNAETWDKKGLKSASERFNYKYTRDELRESWSRCVTSRSRREKRT